ncbi:MAG TPA: hypothetical protein VEK08_02220 [Planctomycetota bacterium]|nr:hypothetical protein [Planctomycetota bacterium]
MGKAILILVVLLVGGVAFILFKGSQVAAPTETESVTETLPDASGASVLPGYDLKNKTSELTGKIKEDIKKAAVSTGISTKELLLRFEREPLEIKAPGKAQVKVIRSGGDMKALKVEVIPAPGSALTGAATEFPANGTEATVHIEAAAGAHDASVTVRAGDATKILPVKVVK